jgi:hypothetical protein
MHSHYCYLVEVRDQFLSLTSLTLQEWPSLGIGVRVAVVCVPPICVKYLNHILDWLSWSEFWHLPLSSAKYQPSTLQLVTTTFAHIPPKFVAYNHLIPYLMSHNLTKYENKRSSWHRNVGKLRILRSSHWCNWEFCNAAPLGGWFLSFQKMCSSRAKSHLSDWQNIKFAE